MSPLGGRTILLIPLLLGLTAAGLFLLPSPEPTPRTPADIILRDTAFGQYRFGVDFSTPAATIVLPFVIRVPQTYGVTVLLSGLAQSISRVWQQHRFTSQKRYSDCPGSASGWLLWEES